MEILDTFKGTLNTAVDTISTVAQNFVEKNRTKAKLNRLRMVMKSESELMNRAYIALGKEYYEKLKKGDAAPDDNQQNLLEVIDNCKAKIARARDCYRKIVESQNEFLYAAPAEKEDYSQKDVIDITVACSNESDYNTSPFDKAQEAVEQAVEIAGEKAEDIKETVEDIVKSDKEKIKEALEALDDEAADKDPF